MTFLTRAFPLHPAVPRTKQTPVSILHTEGKGSFQVPCVFHVTIPADAPETAAYLSFKDTLPFCLAQKNDTSLPQTAIRGQGQPQPVYQSGMTQRAVCSSFRGAYPTLTPLHGPQTHCACSFGLGGTCFLVLSSWLHHSPCQNL